MVQTVRFTGGANREVIDTPGYRCFRLHNTDIVKLANCRSHLLLDSGGHRSTTTKRAMNQAFNEIGVSLRINQSGGFWWVHRDHTDVKLFVDGMFIKLN